MYLQKLLLSPLVCDLFFTFGENLRYNMQKLISCLLVISVLSTMNAQDDKSIPYIEIPAAPEHYKSGNVVARMIDGLGYRYHWATKELRQEDLEYRPSEDAKTTAETLEHLYGLSLTILNGAKSLPNIRPSKQPDKSWEALRVATLQNFKEASDLMRGKKAKNLAKLKIIFQRGERKSEFPYWNMLNGPIADAIYHTGQIVAFRRASGNPIDGRVNVFRGKNN